MLRSRAIQLELGWHHASPAHQVVGNCDVRDLATVDCEFLGTANIHSAEIAQQTEHQNLGLLLPFP